jgi:hypothetical protein
MHAAHIVISKEQSDRGFQGDSFLLKAFREPPAGFILAHPSNALLGRPKVGKFRSDLVKPF